MSEAYLSAELSDTSNQLLLDGSGGVLTITTDHGAIKAPFTYLDQVGFSHVKISANKKLIGWTVEAKTFSNSYSLPLSLIIFENGKVIRKINVDSTIPDWNFEKQDTAVVIKDETAHFVTGISYELYSISSGKLLQRFGCHVDFWGEHHIISKDVPSWVWPLRGEGDCPYATTEPDGE